MRLGLKKVPPPAAPSGHKASLCKGEWGGAGEMRGKEVSSEIVSTVQTSEKAGRRGCGREF